MPKITKIKLTQEELDRANIPSNYVALELLRAEEDATTNGGIYMGYLPDTTWESDDETHPADIASVVGKVVKLPSKLYFNPKDETGMPWDTDLQLQIGDLVWFNHIESLNAIECSVEGKLVRMIPYRDLYAARRGSLTGDVICLNGFVLLEQVRHEKLSSFDVLSEDRIHIDRGIVRYMGVPNRQYLRPEYVDNVSIQVGELAFFQNGYQPFALERKAAFAIFDNGKLYWCVQRRRIVYSV